MDLDFNVLKDTENLRRAVEHYNEAARRYPYEMKVYLNRGFLYYLLEDYKNALKDCDEAYKIETKNKYVQCLYGIVLGKLGENSKAIQHFDICIRLYPDFYQAYMCRSFIERKLGRFLKALKDLDNAIKANPCNFRPYLYRGDVKLSMGETGAAIKDYKRAIHLAPDLEEIINNKMSHTFMQKGLKSTDELEFEQAIRYFKLCIEIDPKNANAYFHMGDAYMNLEEFESARESLEKALKLDPDGKIGRDASEILEIFAKISEIEVD